MFVMRAGNPWYILVLRAGSPWYINGPRAASPKYKYIPRAASPEYKYVPRAACPEYKYVPRAASPKYKYIPRAPSPVWWSAARAASSCVSPCQAMTCPMSILVTGQASGHCTLGRFGYAGGHQVKTIFTCPLISGHAHIYVICVAAAGSRYR